MIRIIYLLVTGLAFFAGVVGGWVYPLAALKTVSVSSTYLGVLAAVSLAIFALVRALPTTYSARDKYIQRSVSAELRRQRNALTLQQTFIFWIFLSAFFFSMLLVVVEDIMGSASTSLRPVASVYSALLLVSITLSFYLPVLMSKLLQLQSGDRG